jgi:hypothetical protein
VRKVFFIGFNKTGTTSLAEMVTAQSDLRARHDPDWTIWTQIRATERFAEADVFSDGEWPDLVYLSRVFPDAVFVLNSRSLRSWIVSRHLAAERTRSIIRRVCVDLVGLPPLAWILSRLFAPNDLATMARWVRLRNSYHRYALAFLRREGLTHLVMDLPGDADAGLAQLSRLLGIPGLVPRHENHDGSGTFAGQVGGVLEERVPREVSEGAVDHFLAVSGLWDHGDNVDVVDDPDWLLAGNHVDTILEALPFLEPLQRLLFHLACRLRAWTTSTAGNLLTDQLLRLVRRELDEELFLPIHRFSSGSA